MAGSWATGNVLLPTGFCLAKEPRQEINDRYCRLSLLRDAPPPAEPPSHATMPRIDGLAVHQRTAAHDALDSVGSAFPDGLFRNAALAEGPVKPDPADATSQTLPHQVE